ncbi:hypothetical protein ACET3Z_015420 [Daucus carota]
MAPKRSKISRDDRISNLPDSLLLLILSLLPFELAVRTSVLSKRWRPLCMSLRNLRFNDKKVRKTTVQFKSAVESFRGGSYVLPPDVYAYEGFEILRLNSRILIDIPNEISFSRVKVLEFVYVKFSSYESVKDLLLNCPVLEDLVIVKCEARGGSCLSICGSALRNLKVKCNELAIGAAKLDIVIDTPGVETLKIADDTWANIFVKDTLLSLRTARIDVGMERRTFNKSVFRLLDNIYHVKFLTLTDKVVGVLDECAPDYHLPTFRDLIELKILVDNWSCWNLLPKMLASSPNLQSLLLPWGVDLHHTEEEEYNFRYSSPRVVPECLSSHLQTIEMGGFHGTADELSLVENFLSKGKVLREISLCFLVDCSESEERSRKSRIRKKLRSFGRSSKTCKIDFY